MRKIVSIISVLLLLYSTAYSQNKSYLDNAEVDVPISIDCQLHAYKSIKLKPGFKIKAGTNVKISLINKDKQGNISPDRIVETNFVATQPVKYTPSLATIADNALVSVKYLDAFGNTEQTHMLNAAPDGRDMVSFSEFNPGSTTQRSFLGFAANTGGAYLDNTEQQQQEFYNNSNDDVADNAQPWSSVTLEDSPIGRLISSTNVGVEMAGHESSSDFSFNEANQVPKWRLDGDVWVFDGYFDADTHVVNKVIDENGKSAVSVNNSLGQTVMTKNGNVENWSVYDCFGRLVHNIPVAAVEAIKSYGSGFRLEHTNNIVKEYVYTYRYVDGIPGVVEKFLPGIKGSIEYVYDKLDRIVLTRNIGLKDAGKWSFIKYDKHGRVIITGTYKVKGDNARSALQELLLQDDIPLFEEYEAVGDYTDYSSSVFPSLKFTDNVESIQIDVCNYYDRYVLPDVEFVSREDYDDSYAEVKGQLTEKKVRVNGGVKDGSYNRSAFYYNQKGKLISTVSTSIFEENRLNRTYIKYDFAGKAEKSLSLYNRKLKSGVFNQMEISQYHTYDRMGRLLKVDQQISGDANGRVTMAAYEYNAMGQMKTKNLHKKADGNFLQTVDYAYNIRGQLTDINSVDDKNSDDVFAMHINYNKQLANSEVTAKSLWNGFISSVEWRSGEGKKQAYAFEYDDNYRLTTAKYAAGDNLNEDVGRFNMSAEYDNMGNITRMQRNGGVNGSLIDDLTYNYTADNGIVSNRLHSVTDASNDNMGNQYGFGKRNVSFVYDDLGNLISDGSRDVYSIKYNDQNLPIKVILSGGKEISYVYTAEGAKLTRVVYDPYTMKSIYTRYEGGFVYETDLATNKLDLKYFTHSQGGRVVVKDNKFNYEYFLSDHLGNVRATIGSDESGNLVLLQAIDYYPFGLTMANGNKANADQPYQYGGKEWQNSTQVYDFHARQYNPALGRWFNIDPMLDKFASVSPYNYCLNNPINLIDPDGKQVIKDKDGNIHFTGADAEFFFARFIMDKNPSMDMLRDAADRLYSKLEGGGGGSFFGFWITKDLDGYNIYDSYTRNKYGDIIFTGVSYVHGNNIEFTVGDKPIRTAFDDLKALQELQAMQEEAELKRIEQDQKWLEEAFFIAQSELALLEAAAKSAVDYTPQLARRGVTAVSLATEKAQWVKITNSLSKVSNITGGVALGLTYVNAGVKVVNGEDNTSTWVDVGIATGIFVGSVLSAPVAIAGGVVYGVARLFWGDEIDSFIDNNIGYR